MTNDNFSSPRFQLDGAAKTGQPIHADQPPYDIWLAGAVSARWLGSAESQAAFGQAAQTGCARLAMDLHHHHAEEPVAMRVRFRLARLPSGAAWPRRSRSAGLGSAQIALYFALLSRTRFCRCRSVRQRSPPLTRAHRRSYSLPRRAHHDAGHRLAWDFAAA